MFEFLWGTNRPSASVSPLHLLLHISTCSDTFNDVCLLENSVRWLLNRHKMTNCNYFPPDTNTKVSLCIQFYVSYVPRVNNKSQSWQTNIWSWRTGRGGNWDLKMCVCLCAHVQPMCLLLIILLSGKWEEPERTERKRRKKIPKKIKTALTHTSPPLSIPDQITAMCC